MASTFYGTDNPPSIKHAQESESRKVYGFGFPVGSKPSGGVFHRESGVELIKNNLKQLILTERGERVMLPRFGMNLRRWLFEPLDQQTFEGIRQEILYSIEKYAGRVKVVRLGVFNNENVSAQGLQGILVRLVVQLKDDENVVFGLDVDLN